MAAQRVVDVLLEDVLTVPQSVLDHYLHELLKPGYAVGTRIQPPGPDWPVVYGQVVGPKSTRSTVPGQSQYTTATREIGVYIGGKVSPEQIRDGLEHELIHFLQHRQSGFVARRSKGMSDKRFVSIGRAVGRGQEAAELIRYYAEPWELMTYAKMWVVRLHRKLGDKKAVLAALRQGGKNMPVLRELMYYIPKSRSRTVLKSWQKLKKYAYAYAERLSD